MRLIIPEKIYGEHNTRSPKGALNLFAIYYACRKAYRKLDIPITRRKIYHGKTVWAFRTVVSTYLAFMTEHILEHGTTIVLPYGLGEFTIRKKQMGTKKLYIDWGKTNKENRLRYHTNVHTRGYVYRWVWRKWKFNSIFVFYPAYALKQRMYRAIMSGKKYI